MNTTSHAPRDVTHTTLAVLFIGMLIASNFWILLPFLISIIWALVIVVATWPTMLKLQALFRGRRGPAVAVMTVALLLCVFVPLTLAILSIIANSEDITARLRSLSELTLTSPPEWFGQIPVIGGKLSARWQELAALTPEERTATAAPYAKKAMQWFLARAGSFGVMMLNFLLTVIIAGIMYAKGEVARAGIISFAGRLAGEDGEKVVLLAAKAIRGVALGVGLTAFVQTAIGGVGLAVTGVPGTALLTAVMAMLCLAQVGPALVLIPATIWVYTNDGALWGTILLVFSIIAVTIDNVLRPIFIKKGAQLPLIMVFAGVIGGLIAFGIVGIFIGPVLLAVSYTLLKAWVTHTGQEDVPVSDGD